MRDRGYRRFADWKREGERSYSHQYPDSAGEESYFYKTGMFLENSRTYDLRNGILCFKIKCSGENAYRISINVALFREGKREEFTTYTASAASAGTGDYTLSIPAAYFDIPDCASYYLKFVRSIRLEGEHPFLLEKAFLVPGSRIACRAERLGTAAEKGSEAVYRTTLENCFGKPQAVSLFWKKYGTEATEEIKMPKVIHLAPWEKKNFEIRVPVTDKIVPGGYEKQRICMLPDGDGSAAEELTFYTSRTLNHPFLLLTQQETEEIREKIRTCDWASENYRECVRHESEWKVPEITGNTSYLFETSDGHHARKCAILYQFGAGEEYAAKAVCFLKELSNPQKGYLRNPRACSQELVHEGEFFKSIAFAYDLVYDRAEFSHEDRRNIEAALRSFLNYIDEVLESGNVSNWALAEMEGALYCAAVLQDMSMIRRFLYGTGGMTDILSRGVMSDGWWYEASIGYNLLAAGIFSEIVHVMGHLGMDLRSLSVPACYGDKIDAGEVLQDGLIAENWGGNDKNYRTIPMLWDSLIQAYDWRGVIFGLNDSAEMKIQGTTEQLMDSRYDLAYRLYGKKEYAALLKQCEKKDRDLLFGVEKLPEEKSDCSARSSFADSSGVCILRSQKEGVPQREQIQAVLKYGSHGGAHGHYDRASMVSLMRYGKSLTGPENVWYSYHTMMYKFYVQTSVNHNMVTVDYKMQEAVRPKRLLFYAGKMLQAAAVENCGRWSFPPYGGWQVNGDKTFRERSWNEGRYLPIPIPEPEYSVRTGFTEPVLTRRLMIVTDDFIVNIDYARAEQEHEFECFYHLRGLRAVRTGSGEILKPARHTEQLDQCPLGGAQFITDCDWYEVKGGAVLEFEDHFGESQAGRPQWLCSNRTGYNEQGILHTRLHVVHPETCTLAVGCDPEYQGVNKQLTYRVETDGEQEAQGQFGAWILGRDTVEVSLKEKKELALYTRVRQVEFEENKYVPMEKTVFWGNPQIILENGQRADLADLPYETENADSGWGVGRDYAGGSVKIQGREFSRAIPAEPEDYEKEAVIRVNLEGMCADKFRAEIGGDYPVGEEALRRRTAAVCKKGRSASFVTLIEMTEGKYAVESVYAEKSDEIFVRMRDGREIILSIQNLDQPERGLSAEIREEKDGVVLRRESTVVCTEN